MFSGPKRAPNATCWAGVRSWSRKKITWCSTRAWRIAAIVSSGSGWARSTPVISAPSAPATRRMFRVPVIVGSSRTVVLFWTE